jgi:hypothetical protein
MTRKRIFGAMLVGMLVVAFVGATVGSSSAQTQDPYCQSKGTCPKGPIITVRNSLIRVKLKRVTVVGTATCGSSACTVTVKGFAAIRRKAGFKAKFLFPAHMAANTSAPIKARLPKKTLTKFRNTKHGHGHIKLVGSISSPTGSDLNHKGKVRFQAKKFGFKKKKK